MTSDLCRIVILVPYKVPVCVRDAVSDAVALGQSQAVFSRPPPPRPFWTRLAQGQPFWSSHRWRERTDVPRRITSVAGWVLGSRGPLAGAATTQRQAAGWKLPRSSAHLLEPSRSLGTPRPPHWQHSEPMSESCRSSPNFRGSYLGNGGSEPKTDRILGPKSRV